MKKQVDVAIIGGGPAGLAAAISCYDQGVTDLLILERDEHLGGILQQCIHNGFGVHLFKEELTGPEYAQRFIDEVERRKIPYLLNSMVLEIDEKKTVYCINPEMGLMEIQAKAIILAMGCRERTRGALKIPGTRPAGVFTAGMAQKLVNLHGYLPGKEIVILGSGDIGLIMARRMTWEGARVKMVCEIMPYSTGLARNVHQCLNDYGIPLKFNCTVVNIHGKERVEGVTIAKVDENRRPIPGTEEYVSCDTLLLSVGLIPENELSEALGVEMDPVTNGPVVDEYRQTSSPGVFACGNVLHVHDLVDYVSEEAKIAGLGVKRYLSSSNEPQKEIKIIAGRGIRYVVPQRLSSGQATELFFRVDNVYSKGKFYIKDQDRILFQKSFLRAAPGEMEKLKLGNDVLSKIQSSEILLELVSDKGEA